MRTKRLLLPLLLTLFSGAAACGSSADPAVANSEHAQVDDDVRGAQVGPNDVTYLFPFDRGDSASVERLVGADWLAYGRSVWPEEIFGGVVDAARNLPARRGASNIVPMSPIDGHDAIDLGIVAGLDKHNWRVVAFRFDPCAAAPPSEPAGCSVQLRLVMQPFGGGLRFDQDTTAHLIYRYGTPARPDVDTRDRIIGDLVRLGREARRVAPEAAGALGVHPALRDGAFRDRVRDFLLTHLRPENLSEVAFMGLAHTRQFGAGSDIWEFFHGDVSGRASRFELAPIVNLVEDGVGPQRSQMLNFRASTRLHPGPRERRADKDDVVNVTTRNTDCVSCHNQGSLSTGTLNRNLRMIGYFEGRPTITERVRRETDAVVRAVNEILR